MQVRAEREKGVQMRCRLYHCFPGRTNFRSLKIGATQIKNVVRISRHPFGHRKDIQLWMWTRLCLPTAATLELKLQPQSLGRHGPVAYAKQNDKRNGNQA